MTLTEFLLARIAEDEDAAKEAALSGGDWIDGRFSWQVYREGNRNTILSDVAWRDRIGTVNIYSGAHVVRWEPTRGDDIPLGRG